MIQLIYLSTVSDEWDGRLDLLCAQSRENNVRDEITGILIRRGDTFLQVLEGPRATVEDTFIRVVTDPRHHALDLLSRRVLTRREFGEWSMIALTDACEYGDALAQVAQIVADDPQARDMLHKRIGG